jgi:lipid A 4'-phosphatase
MFLPRPRFWREVAAPLVTVALVTYVLTRLDVDMAVQRHYWSADQGWSQGASPLPDFLYHYGTWPALALAVGGLLLAVAGLCNRFYRPAWRGALFMTLAMVLGPGLIVNVVFKKEWGRPRPKQVAEFGGQQDYSPFWQSTPYRQGRSFPSGHASMGFFLMMPYFLARRHRKTRATSSLWLVIGIIAGGLIGWARITQGGHFLTDVIWSGALTYACGWFADRLMHPLRVSQQVPVPSPTPETTEPLAQQA